MQSIKQENKPLMQLFMLVALVVAGFILTGLVTLLIGFLIHGSSLLTQLHLLSSLAPQHIFFFKISLTVQQLFVFLFPALVLGFFDGKTPGNYYGIKKPQWMLLVLVFLLMSCSVPLLGLVSKWNQELVLPEALRGVENWMRELEEQGLKATEAILKMTSMGGLIINLLVIAVVPAICEEFIFRGALQRIFLRMMKNPHVAIWVSAAVFSTIHFQFFGFFPRLLLGATFGYIYYWTGSLWYTILAHFLNNAYAVIMAWYLQKQHLPFDQELGSTIHWFPCVISAILTIALFKLIKSHSTTNSSNF